ncbi:MAG: hypothetical protein QOE37_409 [Microbacteriaceae bacterium]|nr:hypothetical protein [Microbacteriaceae bacterium]
MLGPLLRRRGVGLLLFAAVATYGVATRNTVAAMQILAGVFWRKGAQGSALALTAAAVAALSGRRRRHLTEEEYAWADREVFRGALPPRRRIVLTDALGVDGRAFTFPEPGRTIAMHVGPAAFADPLGSPELLLHELTHVWQIAAAPLRILWLVSAIGTQAADLLTHRAYAVPPPGRPFRRFNPEQQAMIVQRWWADGADPGDPYFRYIEGTIRAGRR